MEKMEQVYKYRHYDVLSDDYVYSTRYATTKKIQQIGAEPIYATGMILESKFLNDGWTEKNFDPKAAG